MTQNFVLPAKVAWLGATLGCIGLFACFWRALTLPGAKKGLILFLKPNFTKLTEIRVPTHLVIILYNLNFKAK
jgi:SNF family Na+-dependent transporter